jgi:hypothetical protein
MNTTSQRLTYFGTFRGVRIVIDPGLPNGTLLLISGTPFGKAEVFTVVTGKPPEIESVIEDFVMRELARRVDHTRSDFEVRFSITDLRTLEFWRDEYLWLAAKFTEK